ncbi:MAG: hypothetical protein RLY20_1454 [Verrucomicrobiota bacterium]|jgi:membrane protein
MKEPSIFARLFAELRDVLSGKTPSWADDNRRMPRMHRFVHFWVLLVRSFIRNRCPVRASALAYTTLLALVPLLAVGLSVATLFVSPAHEAQLTDMATRAMVDNIAPRFGLLSGDAEKTREETAGNIRGFIANIRTKPLGLTGTIGLIFVAISLLATIEAAFNDIYGVERGRSWLARVEHYWTAVSLGLALVLAGSLVISAQVESVQNYAQSFGWIGHLLLQGVPILCLSGAFMLFYQLMTNTKVDWQASLIGGVTGGVLWHLNGKFNVFFASKIVATSALYGTLGAIPVFLVGLYFSWLILLLGAQVAYAFQNLEAYLQERVAEAVNQRGREFIAFRLMTTIGVRFQGAVPPASLNRLASDLSIPTRLVHQVIRTLIGAKLVAEVTGPDGGFVPARPLDKITCHDILQAMRASHGQELATRDEPSRKEVFGEFQRILDAEREAASSVTMLTLVNRTPALTNAGEMKVISNHRE